jgi:hypothetical protein
MTKKGHTCKDCNKPNIIHCKICDKDYIDTCFMHYAIKDSWV